MQDNYTQTFASRHKQDLLATYNPAKLKAKVVPLSQIESAAQLIKENRLVAFPTETVYGLGANALNQQALLSIYAAKRRPLSDPIIVHVLTQGQALDLTVTTPDQRQIFYALTQAFWPGPLTVILKADLTKLPKVVTAGTGYVGLRAPKQQTARELLKLSGLPIGAPSANLFGHVSPTEPLHVFNDFYDQQVTIIDGERCEYGLESTVVKLQSSSAGSSSSMLVLMVLRQGSLTIQKLRALVKEHPKLRNLVEVQVKHNVKKEQEYQESPGMMLKHYSPNLPAYLCTSSKPLQGEPTTLKRIQTNLEDCVFISFSSSFDKLASLCTYWKVGESFSATTEAELVQPEQNTEDKFCSPEDKRKMKQLYFLLRKGENYQGKKALIVGWDQQDTGSLSEQQRGALWDKVYRATQNKRIVLGQKGMLYM